MNVFTFLWRRIGKFLAPSIFLLFSFLFFFAPITTSFQVVAHTDKIRVRFDQPVDEPLIIKGCQVLQAHSGFNYPFTGSIELNRGSVMIVERLGTEDLEVKLFRPMNSKDSIVGKMYGSFSIDASETDNYEIVSEMDIRCPNNDSLASGRIQRLLAFNGSVETGDKTQSVSSSSDLGLLRDGKIILAGKSTLSGTFSAGSQPLVTGDVLRFNELVEPAKGFLIMDDKPGMKVIYYTRASSATIDKHGFNNQLTVKASKLDQLRSSRNFQIISLTLALVGLLVSITANGFESLHYLKKHL